jgi:hypothetical protein
MLHQLKSIRLKQNNDAGFTALGKGITVTMCRALYFFDVFHTSRILAACILWGLLVVMCVVSGFSAAAVLPLDDLISICKTNERSVTAVSLKYRTHCEMLVPAEQLKSHNSLVAAYIDKVHYVKGAKVRTDFTAFEFSPEHPKVKETWAFDGTKTRSYSSLYKTGRVRAGNVGSGNGVNWFKAIWGPLGLDHSYTLSSLITGIRKAGFPLELAEIEESGQKLLRLRYNTGDVFFDPDYGMLPVRQIIYTSVNKTEIFTEQILSDIVRVEGHWFPNTITLLVYEHTRDGQVVPARRDTLSFSHVSFDPNQIPDSVFEPKFPADVQYYDEVAGKLVPARGPHYVLSMIARIVVYLLIACVAVFLIRRTMLRISGKKA